MRVQSCSIVVCIFGERRQIVLTEGPLTRVMRAYPFCIAIYLKQNSDADV